MQEHSLSREEEKDHLLNGGWTEDSAFIHFITRLFSILTPHIPGSFLLAEPLFTPLRGNELQTLHSSSSQTTPIAALNALHEFGYWKDNNNQHGVILTPEDAADAVIERCFIDTPTPSSLTILDPACGTGILLCRSLLWAYRNKLFSTSQEAANFIRHSIYGIDRDPVAVSLSRFALLLTLSQLFPEDMSEHLRSYREWKGNFYCGDFLSFRKSDQKRIFDSLEWKNSNLPAQFSHIVANPPYGLSRNGQIREDILKKYKAEFNAILCGKPNKYLLFFAAALSHLVQEGRLSFLIPNSWLGIRSARRFRQKILHDGHLIAIDTFEKRIFPTKGVEAVIVTAQKSFRSTFLTRTFRSIQSTEPSLKAVISCQELLKEDNQAIIPTGFSNDLIAIRRALLGNSITLSDAELCVTPKIALQVYATGKGSPPQTGEIVRSHPFHSASPDGKNSKKYLRGNSVSRFSLCWAGEWLMYGPWVAEHQPEDRFRGPRLLVREIINPAPYSFVATYTEEEFFYNRSILHIIPDNDCPYPERFLLGLLLLLNSKVGTLYLKTCGRKTSRTLFPKVVLEDLSAFPIPLNFRECATKLAVECKRCLRAPNEAFPTSMNREIASLYGLRIEDVESSLRTIR